MIRFTTKCTNLLTPIIAALALTACDTAQYEALQKTEPVAGKFSVALTQGYSNFAKSEIEQQDWPDQHYFAKKGLLAAKGRQPLPEKPASWNISKSDQIAFTSSRENLVHWLNTDARQIHPTRSAKAQVSFDCWVEQKEENWQKQHIDACRQAVGLALPEITQINFSFDRSTLDRVALKEIQKFSDDWQKNPGQSLVLQGHTDPVGGKDYNYRLSKKRAFAVKHRLQSLGVNVEKIQIELWGETRPRQEIADSSAGLSNRRVEILKF